jgi:selenocysteine lyase/cysteine desulfurase
MSEPVAATPPSPSTAALFDVAAARRQFPALAVEQNGQPVVYFDGPAGTQTPKACIAAIAAYLSSYSSNTGGAFLTSQRSDAMLDEVHAAMADFLNAADPREIVFGANMTTLTFAFSRALGATLQPGDEIVITTLDHDGNVSPWRRMAEDRGLTVQMVDIDPATCTLDMDDFRAKINEHTKLVAVGYASNAVGTINDVATVRRGTLRATWANRRAGAGLRLPGVEQLQVFRAASGHSLWSAAADGTATSL